MNYIEFQIGGKLRGFKFGIGFLGDILKHYDVDIIGFGDLISKNPFSVLPAILYYGHYHDIVRKGGAIDFKLYTVEDWVEDIENPMNDANMVSVTERCINSVIKYLPKNENKAVEGEKKS